MSKDGKSLSFYSTFFSKKFEKTETTFISAERDFCIYNFKLKDDAHGLITITGCKNEVREMSIFPTNSPPFNGKIHSDGRVEEIVLPPINDKIIFADGLTNNKTKESGGQDPKNENQTNTPPKGPGTHELDTSTETGHGKGCQTKNGDRNEEGGTSTDVNPRKPVEPAERSAERIDKRPRLRMDKENTHNVDFFTTILPTTTTANAPVPPTTEDVR